MQGQDYVRVVIMAKISELLVQNMQCSSFPQEFDKWTSRNKEIGAEHKKSITFSVDFEKAIFYGLF